MSNTVHTEGVVTLKQIVKSALWQAKRPPSDYRMFYELAYRGYRELRLHHVQEGVRYAKLTPNSINCVDFPEDLVEFVGIGVPVNGKLVPLTRNDDIVITTTLVGAVETQNSTSGEGVDIIDSNTTGFYAKGGINYDGYYKVDWENRRIMLNSVTRTEVILAYVSSGTNAEGETYVPVKYEPALIAYIVWQDSRYDDKRIAIAQYFEQQYNKEILNLDEGPTLQELLDTWISTYSDLPKR
jgi:hypothetical protein